MKIAVSVALVLMMALSDHILGVRGQNKEQEDCTKILTEAVTNPFICTAKTGPVCGTDGWLYDNKCLLCTAALTRGSNIGIRDEKECKIKVDCSQFMPHQWNDYFTCVRSHNPVCGTDNKTYINRCLLCSTIWETRNYELGIKHNGKCE